ncbi:MAG: hypothetical protein ACUVQH_12305 [Thermogutta sp.]
MAENCSPRDAQLTDVIQRLVGDGVEFFLDSHLEPTLHVPDDAFQQDWPVDSQRTQDLLTTVYYETSKGGMLKASEREFLMSQIREECRKGGRRFAETEAPGTDRDVFVQGLLYLMNGRQSFDDRTAVLLRELRRIQREQKISTAEEISVFTNIFSRRLGRLIPTLRGYGILLSFRHQEDGSYCQLQRLPTFRYEPEAGRTQPRAPDDLHEEASLLPSVSSPRQGTTLVLTDDADGEVRFDPPRAKATMSPPQALHEEQAATVDAEDEPMRERNAADVPDENGGQA